MMLRRAWLSVVVAVCLTACGGSKNSKKNGANNSGPTNFTIDGIVTEGPGSGQGGPTPPSALDGGKVQATIDRNHDGSIGAGDVSVSTQTDSNGHYTLKLTVQAGDTVVVGFHDDGAASVYRTVAAQPSGHAILNASLTEMESFTCNGGRCAVQDNSLSVDKLPDGYSGMGETFNPVTQPDAFPGDFSDKDGNLLISGVFATVEIDDDSGNKVSSLSSPVDLNMRMPRDTWPSIVDIDPATTDKIDVPLYAFDDVQGTWVRQGTGYLEDGNGQPLPQSDVASLHDGSYSGVVVATGQVSHFSTWNVDWPISSHGAVTGTIVDTSGNPAKGAVVQVTGLTYTGTSEPQTVGPDGTFCIEAMRSEAAGEDVNGNGVDGETQTVAISVTYQGKTYDMGQFDMPTAEGTCATTPSEDVGSLQLSADKELQAQLCTYQGTVTNLEGTAVDGATVYAWDDSLSDATIASVCGTTGTACDYAATTGSSGTPGSYTINAPVMYIETLGAYAESTPDANSDLLAWAERSVRGCPTGPVDLTLDQGWLNVTITASVSGDQISWSPSTYDGWYVIVSDSAGNPKWMIVTSTAPFTSPVTYGTVPSGAEQVFPYDGSAVPALSSGDQVTVTVSGTSSAIATQGFPYWGSGDAIAP